LGELWPKLTRLILNHQVARDDFVPFFNDVFDALCKLSADVDPNVQNAAHLLDKLIKDIVSESPHFDLIEFITLLRQRLQVRLQRRLQSPMHSSLRWRRADPFSFHSNPLPRQMEKKIKGEEPLRKAVPRFLDRRAGLGAGHRHA